MSSKVKRLNGEVLGGLIKFKVEIGISILILIRPNHRKQVSLGKEVESTFSVHLLPLSYMCQESKITIEDNV